MTTETDWMSIESWLRLSLLTGLGAIRIHKLVDHFGDPHFALHASINQLCEVLPSKLALSIVQERNQDKITKQINKARGWEEESIAHHIITYHSDAYPCSLKVLPDPPVILYVIGDVKLLSEPQLGVVGSRRATPSGLRVAKDFCSQLSNNGLVITSGMALGIDAASHQGALVNGGATIAVLGTGIDQIYPSKHQDLYQLIAYQGALVSEYPLGSAPIPSNFPRRNRILVGLSLGILVIEAALESGSLISAQLAAEQGKEVFSVPGSILNPLSRGCHNLIREGAVLVESSDDIIIELAPKLQHVLRNVNPATLQRKTIDPLQLKIIEAMGFEVASVDQISLMSGIPVPEVSSMLTEMELEGMIESTSGGFILLR